MRIRYDDSVQAGWSGDQISGGGEFSAPFETGMEVHPASWKIVYRFSFLELWRHGRGVYHPLTCKTEVKGRVEVYLYSSLFSRQVARRPLSLSSTSVVGLKQGFLISFVLWIPLRFW